MLETINTPTHGFAIHSLSRPAYEVQHFMDNFFEALARGNREEAETYYADETKPLKIPFDVQRKDEVLLTEDFLATYSCALESGKVERRLTCVLDKSEGYWQIIHGQIL